MTTSPVGKHEHSTRDCLNQEKLHAVFLIVDAWSHARHILSER
jgi:hypothetical protein